MSAIIIDGKETAKQIRIGVKKQVLSLNGIGIYPSLTVILVGDNPASEVYVRNKERMCERCGIISNVIRMPADTTQERLLNEIDRINADDSVHGLLLQLPLPRHLDELVALRRIDSKKDVDGIHMLNAGALMTGQVAPLSCTPAGCVELLKRYDVPLEGAEAVIIGRSNIVGKPLALMLLKENCTVTVCHSRTKNIKEVAARADILVAALGKPEFVTADMVKPGAAVIDVGVNRLEGDKIVGDVKFDEVKEIAGYITPVPGGVGPMTIAMLMKNTMEAARQYAG